MSQCVFLSFFLGCTLDWGGGWRWWNSYLNWKSFTICDCRTTKFGGEICWGVGRFHRWNKRVAAAQSRQLTLEFLQPCGFLFFLHIFFPVYPISNSNSSAAPVDVPQHCRKISFAGEEAAAHASQVHGCCWGWSPSLVWSEKGVRQAALDSIFFPKSFSLRFNLDGRVGVGLSERHECYMLVHSVWGPGWCNILKVGLHAPIASSTGCSKSKKLYDPRCLQHRRHAQTIRQHAKIDDNAFCKWHFWVWFWLLRPAMAWWRRRGANLNE